MKRKKTSKRKSQLLPGTMESLLDAVSRMIAAEGRTRTAKSYRATANRLFFWGLAKVKIEDFCDIHVETAKNHMRKENLQSSTVKFYLSILSSAYRLAVAEGSIPNRNPFIRGFPKAKPFDKRSITLDSLRDLVKLDLSDKPFHALVRDIFVFMVLSAGMSFIDAAHLRTTDIKEGAIRYRRHKTGVSVVAPLHQGACEIMARYYTPGSPYVFPVLKSAEPTTVEYDSALRKANRYLNEVGRMVGLPVLTTHMARHTWATAARNGQLSLSVISSALGHMSERTTRHYLGELDAAMLRRANDDIMRDVFPES